MSFKLNAQAHSTATVLDLSYQQYGVQWQKIGNMQASASSILTVISIIASLMLGILSQVSDIVKLQTALGVFIYSFYVSIFFSFVYLALAGLFVYWIIQDKSVDVLKDPCTINEVISAEIVNGIDDNDDTNDEVKNCLSIDQNMLLKINEEIVNVNKILEQNQRNYTKCLRASFLSLLSSFITLAHVTTPVFQNNYWYTTIVGVIGYLSVVGVILIFLPRRVK